MNVMSACVDRYPCGRLYCDQPLCFCSGYCYSRNVNKVWGIALAWDKPKPDEESGGCTPKTRIPRGVGGRVATSKGWAQRGPLYS